MDVVDDAGMQGETAGIGGALLSLHTSPFWMQNEEPSLHTPASQSCEQHSAPVAQGLPAVRQATFKGWHRPPTQLPPQHEAESAHAWPSAIQVPALQRPLEQIIEQHSMADAHPPPAAVQVLIEAAQVSVAGSQMAEQQSALVAHGWPKA